MAILILGWIICPIIAGIVAGKKNRSGVGWVLLTLLLSPLLLLVLLVLDPIHSRESEKKCPFCAEWVKAEATVCKNCGKEMPAVAKQV